MADEVTKQAFEIDLAQIEQALAELDNDLAEVERSFADTGAQATQHLQGMDTAARQAAGGMDSAATSGQRMGLLGSIFAGSASGVMSLVSALGEASHWAFLIPNSLGTMGTALGNLLGKVHPLGPAMVKSFSDFLPTIKSGLNHVALMDTGLKALRGQLGVVGAAMGYFQARAVGASRSLAAGGAAAALMGSTIIGTGRAMVGAIGTVTTAAVSSAGAIGMAFAPFIAASAPLIAVAAALALVAKGVSSAAGFETMRTSFRTLVGDVAVADKAIKDLMKFSDETPFEDAEVAEAGRGLVAFGFAAEELKPILTDVGDLAAASNKELVDVGRAFGRIKSGDFGEAFERMRDFGISRSDLEGKGLVFDKGGSYKGTADQAITAVRAIIREKFGGSMEDLSKTWSGMWSTLVSKGSAAMREFGAPIMEALKPVMAELIKNADVIVPLFAQIGIAVAGIFQMIVPAIKFFFDTFRAHLELLVKLATYLNGLFGFKPIVPAANSRDRATKDGDSKKDKQAGSGEKEDFGTSSMRQHGGGGTMGVAGLDPMVEEQRRANEHGAQTVALLWDIRDKLNPKGDKTSAAPSIPLAYAT